MILKTERLILRPFTEADAESVYEYAKDPAVGPAAGWPPHASVENSREVIRNVLMVPETYAVCLKEDGRAIGSASIMIGGGNMKIPEKEAEIGYWLGAPFWGRGLIPEAVGELIRRAFEDLGIETLWCGYFDGNEKSKRVQEKCGFVYHHTNRDVEWKLMDRTFTEHVSVLTREAWEASRRGKNAAEEALVNAVYEHKNEMTFIGFSTEIPPDEGYVKCPEFWDREYNEKYAHLWQTMQPETPVEQAILDNGIGMFAICADGENSFDYWIVGFYRGGAVPAGLKLFTVPESDWAVFTAKGPLADTLQALNSRVMGEWLPAEGKKRGANGRLMIETYTAGDPRSADYVSGIWVPVGEKRS